MTSFSAELTLQHLKLRFFDLEVDLQSDSSTYIDLFTQMYRRFQVNGASVPVRPPAEFAVLTKPNNPWGQPVMVLDGQTWPLDAPDLQQGYVYDTILSQIVAGVRSHFLIHAGVVANGDQGVILAADSCHGKTTLALELVRRGFRFLSDEMAALGRSDQQVHPFPRSLRVRARTLELAGFPEAAVGAPEWLGKLLLDIDQIQPGSMGEAVNVDHVIILQDPAAPEEQVPASGERELSVLVNHLNETLLAAVRQIKGVTEVRGDVERGYPTIRLRTTQRMAVVSQIEALCQEQQVLILDISKRAETQPTFETPARLEAIPKSQTVMELLRRFQGGHKSALLNDEFGGSSSRLFMELAALIGQANCYQLFVGPLSEMADLVCGLVDSDEGDG
jgi:hypothetical protein